MMRGDGRALALYSIDGIAIIAFSSVLHLLPILSSLACVTQ